MDGSSIEAVLYCIHEFQETADELDYNTGAELFTNFRRVLRGAAKDDWDSVISNIPNHTQATFLLALERWRSEMILPTARQTLVDYLKNTH
jgi:hypothetical protein